MQQGLPPPPPEAKAPREGGSRPAGNRSRKRKSHKANGSDLTSEDGPDEEEQYAAGSK